MSLKIYNSLTRKKEEFKSQEPGRVRMYVCGPTVYDFLHVGNFRGPVFFNMVRNWLEKSGYKVEYALNFTDIDDRIINKALAENKSASEISERYIAEYKKDFEILGLKKHDYNPKVTDYLDDIETMIKQLVTNKKAYEVEGDVYFQVDQFPQYGKLSGRNIEELQSGSRIEVDERKKSPMDFALWKKAKTSEPSWPSSWGAGRPGWHIECSAMIQGIFKGTIDIHGGGLDLLFPHHENEIAQSEAALTDQKFVNYWMHWNMLNLTGQKMSKSLGNTVSLREFATKNPSEVYKWMILAAHYRSVLDFGEESLNRAISSLARIYSSMSLAENFAKTQEVSETDLAKAATDLGLIKAQTAASEALNDDFNTPEVWAALYEVVRLFNSKVKRGAKVSSSVVALSKVFLNWIHELGAVMSLFQKPADEFLRALDDLLLKQKNLQRSDIDQLVAARAQARAAQDFAQSDVLRKKLTDLGISVMDLPLGSFWEVTK
jgi:cysteinyl-tRNA synthetase